MEKRSQHRSQRRRIVGAAATAALVVLVILIGRALREGAAAEPHAAAGARRAVHRPAVASNPSPEEKAAARSEVDGHTTRLRPLIADIDLDKRRACPGETIQARMHQRSDVANAVQYSIPGYAAGDLAILSYDTPGEQTIHVVASDGVGGLDYKSVTVQIADPASPECAAMSVLAVTAIVSNDDDDSAAVQVVRPRALRGKVRYTYDYGDGTTEESVQPHRVHSYRLRAQDDPSSTFLVNVHALDEHGMSIDGRASVNLRNVHWLSTTVGSPMMPVNHGRFAEQRGGAWVTDLAIRNIDKLPVDLVKATAHIDGCNGQQPSEKVYSASQLLGGLHRIEGGQVAQTTLSMPEADMTSACRVLVVLEGDTVPSRAGTPIGGNLPRTFDTTRANVGLEIHGPPLAGAQAEAAPVGVSDDMARVLEKAAAILGPGRPITPDELRRLKREGLLD